MFQNWPVLSTIVLSLSKLKNNPIITNFLNKYTSGTNTGIIYYLNFIFITTTLQIIFCSIQRNFGVADISSFIPQFR